MHHEYPVRLPCRAKFAGKAEHRAEFLGQQIYRAIIR
jgi:hypothetical protein